MNHLLREHAPITRRRLGGDRRRGARAPRRRRSPRASSSTSPARTAGSTRPPTSAASRRSTSGPSTGVARAPAPRPAAGRAAGATFTVVARRAARRRPRRRRTSTSTPSTRPRAASRDAENVAVFHGWPDAGHRRHRRGVARTRAIALERRLRRTTRATSREAVEMLLRGGIGGPVRARARPRRLHRRRSRRPSTAATRCSTTCARSSAARSSGRPASSGAVVLSLRGGDFLFESGQDLSIGYDHHDAETRPPLPGGELQLPRGDAGGGGRADDVKRRSTGLTVDRLGVADGVAVLQLCDWGAEEPVREPHRHDYHELIWIRARARAAPASTASASPVRPGTVTLIGRGQVHVFERGRAARRRGRALRDEVAGAAGAHPAGCWPAAAAAPCRPDAASATARGALATPCGAELARPADARSAELAAPPAVGDPAVDRALVRREPHRAPRRRRRRGPAPPPLRPAARGGLRRPPRRRPLRRRARRPAAALSRALTRRHGPRDEGPDPRPRDARGGAPAALHRPAPSARSPTASATTIRSTSRGPSSAATASRR